MNKYYFSVLSILLITNLAINCITVKINNSSGYQLIVTSNKIPTIFNIGHGLQEIQIPDIDYIITTVDKKFLEDHKFDVVGNKFKFKASKIYNILPPECSSESIPQCHFPIFES